MYRQAANLNAEWDARWPVDPCAGVTTVEPPLTRIITSVQGAAAFWSSRSRLTLNRSLIEGAYYDEVRGKELLGLYNKPRINRSAGGTEAGLHMHEPILELW